jgi:hypothetical protein
LYRLSLSSKEIIIIIKLMVLDSNIMRGYIFARLRCNAVYYF